MAIGRHRRRGWCWLAAGMLLPGLGCNARPVDDHPIPAEVRAYAKERCLRLEHCECPNLTFADRAECEARIFEVYEREVAGHEGVVLECFAQGAQLWRTAECEAPHDDVPCSTLPREDGVGAPCNYNPFRDGYVQAYACTEGFTCIDERCVELIDGPEGAPCTSEAECGRGLTCIGGRCEPYRAEGEPCEAWINCEAGEWLRCSDGLCIPYKDYGEACEDRSECKYSGLCVDGVCSPLEPLLCIAGGDLE